MNTTTLSSILLLCLFASTYSFGQTSTSVNAAPDDQILTSTVEISALRSDDPQLVNRPISGPAGTKFDFHDFFANVVEYPDIAAANAMEGTVTLRLWVGSNGTVKILGVNESDYYLLDNAVLKAAEHLPKLSPAIVDGQAIGQLVLIPVHFYME